MRFKRDTTKIELQLKPKQTAFTIRIFAFRIEKPLYREKKKLAIEM